MICVCGLGYVGLVTALCLSDNGYEVVGVDKDEDRIKLLQQGVAVLHEKDLSELLNKVLPTKKIEFSSELKSAVIKSDIIFICTGTPTVDGKTDLSNVYEVLEDVCLACNSKKYIVVKSTVPVGTCEKMQEYVCRKLPRSDAPAIISNPEFLREGNAINDFLFPDRVIIGSSQIAEGRKIGKIFKSFLSVDTPIIYTNLGTSEMIKYVSNSFLGVKVSFINEISSLAAKLDVNIEDIEYAVGLDKRIGCEHFSAGPGFGGSCIPKDMIAFTNFAAEQGVDMILCQSALSVNKNQIANVYRIIKASISMEEETRIAIFGIAFKKGTDDLRSSPAIELINMLLRETNYHITVYDPIAKLDSQEFPFKCERVIIASNMHSALQNTSCLVIMTDADEFVSLELDKVEAVMKTPLIVDCKKIYYKHKDKLQSQGIQYRCVGLKYKE